MALIYCSIFWLTWIERLVYSRRLNRHFLLLYLTFVGISDQTGHLVVVISKSLARR